MGNVMCCCKGREKSLEEGKGEDPMNLSSMNKGNLIKKKHMIGGTTPGEETELDGKQGGILRGAKKNKNENKENNGPAFQEQGAKSMSNFSTFGGENFILEEDNLMNNNNNNIPISSKPVKRPDKNNNQTQANSAEKNLIAPSSNKPERTLNNLNNIPTTQMSTQPTPSPKSSLNSFNNLGSKIYIRISIECVDITYKLIEDFGISFKPYLEISVPNQEIFKAYPTDIDLDRSLNASNISGLLDNDTSMNLSQNLKSNTSTSFIMGKERNYPMKFVKCVEVPIQDFYSNIVFTLKNELPGVNNKSSNNSSNNLGSSGSNQTSNLPPNVIIGEAKIAVNLLFKNFKENSFDGNLELKFKNSSLIGYLKIILTASEKSLINQEEFFDKLQKAKFLDVSDDEGTSANMNTNKLLDNISSQSQRTNLNLWEFFMSKVEDINPQILDEFFYCQLSEEDEDDEGGLENLQCFALAKRIRQTNDAREFQKLYLEAKRKENQPALYQIYFHFSKMTTQNDYKFISEFMKNLNEDEKREVFELPKCSSENAYLIKQYLMFLYNYYRYFKNNKSLTIRNNKDIEDSCIARNVIDILTKLSERIKNQPPSQDFILESRDCVLWSLNILNELVNSAPEITSTTKMSKEESNELKRKEYTSIYENCIQIISKRIYVLRLIDSFMLNSEVIGSIFRLFRKTIQVLTNESSNLLDLKKLNIHPKEFASKFRKLIIEQNDGIYFTTLKIMLMKYQHYPELHLNILIIIYQLTNKCDSQSLILAADKLNLLVFKDVFEIYRGRLRSFNKMLNSLHLNILSNFSELPNEENYENLTKLISLDVKSYYKMSPNYKRRLDDFRIRKKTELEIHETMVRIGSQITKSHKNCEILMDSFFFDDVIEYLIIIGVGEHYDDTESLNEKSSNQADFILKLKEKKKKQNLEEIKKSVAAVVENSLIIILNVMGSTNELSDPFSTKLAEHDIGSADDLFELIDECRNLMIKYGIKTMVVDERFETLKNLFE